MTKRGRSIEDVSGQKFGALTAVMFLKTNRRYEAVWRWQCECGADVIRTVTSAKKSQKMGFTVSCRSCLPSGNAKAPGFSNRKNVIYYYQRNARDRGLEWRLTEEHLDSLFSSNCHYCGIGPKLSKNQAKSNGEFIYQGIDRIDSELDYVPFNVLPCCKDCNYAKRDRPYLEFVSWIKSAAAHLTEAGI